jgi:BMFP domain-containing protein YqiC
LPTFLAEVSVYSTFFSDKLNRPLQDTSIQQGILQLKENVTQISALHTQSINAVGAVSHTETDTIDSLTARTRTLIQDLKQRIKRLESAPQQQDAQLRNNRVILFFTQIYKSLRILLFQDISFKVKIP